MEHLTIDVCKPLPYFYVFTGCDTVPSFNGKDKWVNPPFLILGWEKKESDLTKTFNKLRSMPELINSDDRNTLQFLVKTVYFRNVKDIGNSSLNEMKKT